MKIAPPDIIKKRFFPGLTTVHVQVSTLCNKSCAYCEKKLLEKEYPEKVNWGNMTIKLAAKIAHQLPNGIIVNFGWGGEPLLHPDIGWILRLFVGKIKCITTNAKLLYTKKAELSSNCDVIIISVKENDPTGDEQYAILEKYIKAKKATYPRFVYCLQGDVEKAERWYKLPGSVVTREAPAFNPKNITVPVDTMCLCVYSQLAIDRFGFVYPCTRYNPLQYNRLGNIDLRGERISAMWNSLARHQLVREHAANNRKFSRLCGECPLYGYPSHYSPPTTKNTCSEPLGATISSEPYSDMPQAQIVPPEAS